MESVSPSRPRIRMMKRSHRGRGNVFVVASLLLVIIFLPLLASAAVAGEVCTSKGGRFPPYSGEGKPPRKVTKGPKDLTLCRVFRRKTCCDVSQTNAASVTMRKLAVTGGASAECLELWELLECSICDPLVGVKPGPPLICPSLCDRIFEACSSAYFSSDAIAKVLAPCGTTDIICAKGTEWVSNGTDLCEAAGFAVKKPLYPCEEETSCYGNRASLDSIADSWNSRSDFPEKTKKEAVAGHMIQQMKEMPLRKKVIWAVGGMVLTAGLLVLSKRKKYGQRKSFAAKLAAKEAQKSVSPTKWSAKGKGRRLAD